MQSPSPLSRIVVATDFSGAARRALGRALLLPLTPEAEVVLLNAWTPEDYHLPAEVVDKAATARMDAEVLAARDALATLGATGVTVRPVCVRGPPVTALLEAIRTSRPDVVVAGRRGAGGLRGSLIGSTAERLAWGASVPVLLVGPGARRPYDRPLVALGHHADAHRVVEAALSLCDASVRVDLLHAYHVSYEGWLRTSDPSGRTLAAHRKAARDEATAFLEQVRRRLAGNSHRADFVLRSGDPRVVILRVSAQRGIDLVAIGSHRRAAHAFHVLVGSVALAVVRHARCDVLTVPL